jgi:hypothetical protein
MKNTYNQNFIKAFDKIKIHIPKRNFIVSINKKDNIIYNDVKLFYIKSKEQKEEDKKRKEYEELLKEKIKPKILSKEEIDLKKVKKIFLKKRSMYKSLSNKMLIDIIFENQLFKNYILKTNTKQLSINLNSISSNENQSFQKKHIKNNTYSFTNPTTMFLTSINTTNQNTETNFLSNTITYSKRNSLKKKAESKKKDNNKTQSIINFEKMENLLKSKNIKKNLYKSSNEIKKFKESFIKFRRKPINIYNYQRSKNQKSIEIFSNKNKPKIIKLINEKNNQIFNYNLMNKNDLIYNKIIDSSYNNHNRKEKEILEKKNEIEKYIDYKQEKNNFDDEILKLNEKNRKNKLLNKINDEVVYHNYKYILELYGLNKKKNLNNLYLNNNNEEQNENENNEMIDVNNQE